MKIDFELLVKVIFLEIFYSVVLFFASFLFLWGYFGEGAGSMSPTALLWGRISIYIVLFPPIIFNLYKNFKEFNTNFITYLLAEISILLFFSYSYFKGFIVI
ncbi:hypothetical protein [Flavobacterium terrisoli]|uniref:hypothetical protein n=1 Tax=Flavobacterium terrisoli TaxID=3242195 RepID=UPI00254285AE|nr:hypothetical protein [Flavobacterium buctense]